MGVMSAMARRLATIRRQMLMRNVGKRIQAERDTASIQPALIIIPAETWKGAIHVGALTGSRTAGGKLELQGLEIIYRADAGSVVMRLSALGPAVEDRTRGEAFDPASVDVRASVLTLSRLVGTALQAPAPTQSLSRSREVCGVSTDVTQSLPGTDCQQAAFEWRGTRVSVASWHVPLDQEWFRSLQTLSVRDVTELREALRAKPLVLTITDVPH